MLRRSAAPLAAVSACLALVAPAARAQAPTPASPVPQRLDSVRVVGSRVDGAATRSVQVITREEIARSAATTLADVLATRLSLDVAARSPAQADVALRGGTSAQVLVLVDGARVSDLQSEHYTLDLDVPLSAIERVEILRGTGSTLYGADAVGGVINVVTRRGARPAELALRGGSFGTARADAAAGAGTAAASLSAAGDAERSDGHRPGTDYQVTEGRLAGEARAARGVVRLEGGAATRAFGAARFYAPYPSFERTETTSGALRYESAWAGPWALATRALVRRHHDDFVLKREAPSFYHNEHLNWQTEGEAVARWRPAGALGAFGAAVGVDAFDAQLASARLGHRREQRAALFGEASARSAGGAVGTAGLRVDRSRTDGAFASPSLGASLPLGGAAVLRASASRAFRAPTWTERYYVDPANVGDASLRPETFAAAEAGLRAAGAWGAVDVAAYGRRATNLIDWVKPAGSAASVPWRARNVGRATYRGAEAELTPAPALGVTWTLHGDALALDVPAGDGLVGKYALRPITRSVGTRATFAAGLGATATVDATWRRRRDEGAHLAGAVRLARAFGPARATLDVTNLFGAGYLDVSGAPVAGRAVYAGLAYTAR